MDVAGSIGTELCNGDYADIIVGSFGKWKLIEAKAGGFVSSNNQELFTKLKITKLEDPEVLRKIEQKIKELPDRIKYLTKIKKKIVEDLKDYNILYPNNTGFVVVILYDKEKETIINYCNENELEYTECPRYIRVNKPAISIEVKRK